jgi:hypothetical protein
MRTFARRGSAALLSVIVVAGLAPQASAGPVGIDRAQEVSAPQAAAALAAVEAAFTAPTYVSTRRAIATGRRTGREATLALRDLRLMRSALSEEDQATADAYLARPTDGQSVDEPSGYTTTEATPVCGTNVCIHYVTTTGDAVDVTDTTPADGIPDWVQANIDVFEEVWASLVALGYRSPLNDTTSPNNGAGTNDPTGMKFDVYLTNLFDDGLYGYCTSDDPAQAWSISAYCVVDNDFAGFGATPLANLQVTAAHEFFHAAQFGYDSGEDYWFMESTAAWIEDVLYDDIDDNVQYLRDGTNPLQKPHVPLDKFAPATPTSDGYAQYGSWLWFRYLSEKYATPDIVLRSWQLADSTKGMENDLPSTYAVKAAIGEQGDTFPAVFAGFALGNRVPWKTFDEGLVNTYPAAPLSATFKLSPAKLGTGWLQVVVNHLATRHIGFNPNAKFKATNWRLKVSVALPKSIRGVRAYVVIVRPNSAREVRAVKLNSDGDGVTVVPFFVGRVNHIELSLVNTSTRFTDCWVNSTPYTCSGTSLDEGLKSYFVAKAFRR